MISLFLITGFLGSGKTTFLRQIHLMNPNKNLVFLVNDFSSVDIDYQVLSEEKDEVISVAGGSIFCQCLVTEFISQLKSIPEKFKATETVIIEASGMANPSTFYQMLKETKLNKIYNVQSVITVVDPVTLPILYQTLPNIKTQIKIADQIILNKIDLVSTEKIEEVCKIIESLNSKTTIYRTDYCKLDFNPITIQKNKSEIENMELSNQFKKVFGSYSYKKKKPLNIEKLKQLINKHKDNIYRIKGFASSAHNQIKHIDYDGSVLKVDDVNTDINISLEFIFSIKIQEQIKQDIKSL